MFNGDEAVGDRSEEFNRRHLIEDVTGCIDDDAVFPEKPPIPFARARHQKFNASLTRAGLADLMDTQNAKTVNWTNLKDDYGYIRNVKFRQHEECLEIIACAGGWNSREDLSQWPST